IRYAGNGIPFDHYFVVQRGRASKAVRSQQPAVNQATGSRVRSHLMKAAFHIVRAIGLAITIGVAISSGEGAMAAEALKIGVMSPFTGPAARVGQDVKNGVAMAYAEAKAAGEIPVKVGGEPRDMQFIWIDDESSPEKAVRATRRAITEDKVDLLFFGWHSSVG